MIQDFVSTYADEIAYRYNHLKELATHRCLTRLYPSDFPSPKEMSSKGRFICCMQGLDSYEEFQWNEVGQFQIRIRFNDYKVTIEVEDIYNRK